MNEEQLAELYGHVGVTVRLIREHRKSGKLKHVSFSQRKFGYPEEAVTDWLADLISECRDTKKIRSSNTNVGGSSRSPTVHSGMEPDTIRKAEESAARALGKGILKPPRTH
jgi:hypothetical protein